MTGIKPVWFEDTELMKKAWLESEQINVCENVNAQFKVNDQQVIRGGELRLKTGEITDSVHTSCTSDFGNAMEIAVTIDEKRITKSAFSIGQT